VFDVSKGEGAQSRNQTNEAVMRSSIPRDITEEKEQQRESGLDELVESIGGFPFFF
jgi:hypothetical protein